MQNCQPVIESVIPHAGYGDLWGCVQGLHTCFMMPTDYICVRNFPEWVFCKLGKGKDLFQTCIQGRAGCCHTHAVADQGLSVLTACTC